MKNSKEPRCWKWWSFNDQEYWTVDVTDIGSLLLRLRQLTDAELQDHEKRGIAIGTWIPECVASEDGFSDIDRFHITTILRVDKLFSTSFSTAHKDYIDPKARGNAFNKGAQSFKDFVHDSVCDGSIDLDINILDHAYQVFRESHD